MPKQEFVFPHTLFEWIEHVYRVRAFWSVLQLFVRYWFHLRIQPIFKCSSSFPGRHLIKIYLLFYQLRWIVQISFTNMSICLQAPIRSSKNPTCSLSESMRSSCCRECDRKLVLSGRKLLVSPTPSKGKSVVKGARTISSFYRERERGRYFTLTWLYKWQIWE